MASLSPSIRRLKNDASECDVQAATKVMQEAFEDGKLMNMLVGGHKELLFDMELSIIKSGLVGGEVYVAEDARSEIVGAIVWFGPDQDLLHSAEQSDAGFKKLMDKLFEKDPDMLSWWKDYFTPTSSRFTANAYGNPQYRFNSWYLFMIGVRPSCQHRGVGTAMIQHMENKIKALPDASKDSQRMTVGTDSQDALSFYKRQGFVERGVMEVQSVASLNMTTPMWCLSKDVV